METAIILIEGASLHKNQKMTNEITSLLAKISEK